MKTSIALIGFMGTGKTAVGRLLAEKLGREFIELDWLIERRAGKSIPDIFRQGGEIAFRELEIEAVKEASIAGNAVIACGGGVVLNKINVDRLREVAYLVYLTASPSAILKRVAAEQGQRPLLAVPDPLLIIRELLRFRKPFYVGAADITISTTRLDVKGVVEKIVDKLREDESFNL